VPERRQEVTTEGGLDVRGNLQAITETCKKMNGAGIKVSLFIAPDPDQIEASARTGAEFIELHTGAFAEEFRERAKGSPSPQPGLDLFSTEASPAAPGEGELLRLIVGAKQAREL